MWAFVWGLTTSLPSITLFSPHFPSTLVLWLLALLVMPMAPAATVARVLLPPPSDWATQCVDCPKFYEEMTDRSLRLNAANQPHLAYGGDHLYYAWRDGSGWRQETVDAAPSVGAYAALILDSDGLAHISYYDNNNNDLKYARQLADGWVITTVASEGVVGANTSIALDVSGQPVIAFYDEDGSAVKLARKAGVGWSIATVDDDVWAARDLSLALGAQDHASISYYEIGANDLRYAHETGQAWSVEIVDSAGDVGSDSSLALDDNGVPHIAYYDFSNGDLKYAHHQIVNGAQWSASDGVWDIQVVDGDGDVGGYVSLILDSAGHPRVAYHDWTEGDLKYAAWTDSGWDVSIVANAGDVGAFISLALDALSAPTISFQNISTGDLVLAKRQGDIWSEQMVDRIGNVGEATTLVLDAGWKPHITYYDTFHHDLKYAWWTGGAWVRMTVDDGSAAGGIVADDVGSESALALDLSGRPHIAYLDASNSVLKYARWAGEATGLSAHDAWQIQIIDSSGQASGDVAMVMDSADLPHFVYYRDADHYLYHTYWTGAKWVAQPVAPSGQADAISLAFANNTFHIAYYDSVSGDLMYARRYLNGDWTTVAVDAEGDIGTYVSLALDRSGSPHIVYYNWRDARLKYARQTGATWEIETLPATGPVGGLALAVENSGVPRLAYYTENEGDLHGAWRAEPGWTSVIVDAVGDVGKFPSLALEAGMRPHLSYYDVSAGDLRYAVASPLQRFYLPLLW